jgi:hypothetical protein
MIEETHKRGMEFMHGLTLIEQFSISINPV